MDVAKGPHPRLIVSSVTPDDQLADPVADGQAWAQRQQEAFPEWVTRYGGGDPDRWDFGLDSLNVLSYIIFDDFPTMDAIDDPDNAAFTEPAAWSGGDRRRSDAKKMRWSRQDYGFDAGHYVVQPKAKTRAWRRLIRRAPTGRGPLWGTDVVARVLHALHCAAVG